MSDTKERKIKTNCICPPIPVRQFDWVAWFDGEEEGAQGYGTTEPEAIADLKQRDWEASEDGAEAESYPNPHLNDASTGAATISSPVGPPPAGPVAPVSYFENNFPLARTLLSERDGCGGGSSAIKPKVDDRSAPRAPEDDGGQT